MFPGRLTPVHYATCHQCNGDGDVPLPYFGRRPAFIRALGGALSVTTLAAPAAGQAT